MQSKTERPTCSAPFSFSGRLFTSEFVNFAITKLPRNITTPLMDQSAVRHSTKSRGLREGTRTYLAALSKKFLRYFLPSTRGFTVSLTMSKARASSSTNGDGPVTSVPQGVRVRVLRDGSMATSSSRSRSRIADDATLSE